MIRDSPVYRSRQLGNSVERPYRLRVINFQTFLIHGFVSINFLAVFRRRVVN